MTESIAEQKRETMLTLLDRGLVMVHLDPRASGVTVPERFRQDPLLRLNIAYGFNLPALDIDDEGIYAVLSFSGQDYGCTLPWSAIFAITLPDDGHEGRMWASSLPEELRAAFQEASLDAAKSPAPPEPSAGAKPAFRVLDGGATAEEAQVEPAPPKPSARPSLKLVKD